MFSVRTPTRHAAVALAASFTLFGLAACGGGSDDAAPAKKTSSSASSTPTASESATAPATSGAKPDWANPVSKDGTRISTIKAGDIKVDAYQVGVTKATKTGQFVDPESNKPIIAKGDDIVFVNYVITNTGDPINLGSSLVDVTARYDNWKYLQGMDSVVDSALFEQQKVNSDALASGAYKDPSIYTLGKGQTYSVGENFRYQKNSPIKFEVDAIPVDAKGELLHDKKLEGKGSGTIK